MTKIGEYYSFPKELHWLGGLLQKHSVAAYNYINAIEPNVWRCTSWLNKEETLPPRYQIYTTNSSESVNNMFLAIFSKGKILVRYY